MSVSRVAVKTFVTEPISKMLLASTGVASVARRRPARTSTARPKRRSQAQPRAAHDPRHPETLTPRHDRLHRTPPARRQDTPRSKPLPQALPRSQPLPAAREPSTNELTNIDDMWWGLLGASVLVHAGSFKTWSS